VQPVERKLAGHRMKFVAADVSGCPARTPAASETTLGRMRADDITTLRTPLAIAARPPSRPHHRAAETTEIRDANYDSHIPNHEEREEPEEMIGHHRAAETTEMRDTNYASRITNREIREIRENRIFGRRGYGGIGTTDEHR